MSYTDDRDEIAEMFGIEPKEKTRQKTRQKARGGYSEETSEPPSASETKQSQPRQQTSLPPKRTAPEIQQGRSQPAPQSLPKQTAPSRSNPAPTPRQVTAPSKEKPVLPTEQKPVTPKKPVKLTPPSHVEPHPLHARKTPAPASTQLPEIKDEELNIYGDSELPDFTESDFISFDEDPPRKKKTSLSSKTKRATQKNAPQKQSPQTSAPPVEEASPPPAASPEPPQNNTTPPGLPETVLPAPDTDSAAAFTATSLTGDRQPSATVESEPAPHKSPPTEGKMLMQTHGIVKIYDGRTVVKGVDINVRPGEIVGLLGPNGAGKTTSFYMIVGLVPPNDGQVLFNGNDVTHMPMYKRARLGMGYLPQEESIFRKLTVEENIMAVMETLKIPKKEKIERCNELLERFSITHIRNNVALTCSGGEKRRLTIARSLVTEPSLIMLDEPFSGVDPIAVNEIQSIVSDLRDSGLAILITDHNARQTLELVDRAYLIYEGSVLREGSRDFLINDPVSRELYLGDRFTM